MKRPIAVLLVSLNAMMACSGGGSKPAAPLSGNWQLMLKNANTSAVKSESGFLQQSGSDLSGSVLLTGQTACPGVGSVAGQVNGSAVNITVIQVGETVNLTGTVTGNNSTMSGDYSIFASPCGLNQYGTWSASLVHALSGNFTGTLTSSTTAGLVTNVTGSVAQGPNNGESTATLSGNMTSTDAPCLSNANVSGQISGTAVVLNFQASDGTSLGQYTGTVTLDATNITGNYDIFPQSTSGCQDAGTATFVVQPNGTT